MWPLTWETDRPLTCYRKYYLRGRNQNDDLVGVYPFYLDIYWKAKVGNPVGNIYVIAV